MSLGGGIFCFKMYTLFNIYPKKMIHINMKINHIDLPVLKSQDLEFLELEIEDDILFGEFAWFGSHVLKKHYMYMYI